jgi:hypothetical protein
MYAGKRHTYMLKLNADEYVDSTRMGCLARFINHCCEPNCVMQRWIVGRRQVVALFAKHHIPAGSELTFDYDMEFSGTEHVACLCGAPKCRGSLGKPRPEDAAPPPTAKGKAAAGAAGKAPAGKASAGKQKAGQPPAPAAKGGAAWKAAAKGGKSAIKKGGAAKAQKPAARTAPKSTPSKAAKGAAEAKSAAEAGAKREREEGGDEGEDFFASLDPKERKRQMLALKRLAKGRS